MPLRLAGGDRVSDLAVAPDGGRLAYSVTHADGSGELRVADLSDGATLAASGAGTGQSPSWSPTDQSLVVIAHSGGRPEIRVASVGAPAAAGVQGSIASFVNAQITRDTTGLRALSDPGVPVDDLPDPSRVIVVRVARVGRDAWRASLRLLVDPSPTDRVARWAHEMLRLRRDPGSGRVVVANASATTLADVAPGPHVVGVETGSRTGTVALTFDADLEASSVPAATVVRAGGRLLRAGVSFDAATRTVTVTVPDVTGPVTLMVTTKLRDISGHGLSAPFRTSVTL